MALGSPIDDPPEVVKAALAPLRHDFSIALYSPGNPFAVGAVIRVAHNFLAREVLLVGEAPWYEKGSMGMEKYEDIRVLATDEAFRSHVRGRPVWGLEKDRARRSLYAVTEFPRDVVLLLGSERFGIPEEMIGACDDVLGIPVYGVNHSLPVAIATGIVVNEWARLRYARGLVV